MDDALSVRWLDSGSGPDGSSSRGPGGARQLVEVGVHIADVSYFVRQVGLHCMCLLVACVCLAHKQQPAAPPSARGRWLLRHAAQSFTPPCAAPGLQGGLLESEAASRCTTVYLVDRRLDMLPALLSEDLCSLRGGQGGLLLRLSKALCRQHIVAASIGCAGRAVRPAVGSPTLSPFLDSTFVRTYCRPLRCERAVDAGCPDV